MKYDMVFIRLLYRPTYNDGRMLRKLRTLQPFDGCKLQIIFIEVTLFGWSGKV